MYVSLLFVHYIFISTFMYVTVIHHSFFSTGKLKHGVVISTTPTVGFNVCVISVHGL